MKKLFNMNVVTVKILLIILGLSFSMVFIGSCTNNNSGERKFFHLSPEGYETMVAWDVQIERQRVERLHNKLADDVEFLSELFYEWFQLEISANSVEEFWKLYEKIHYENSHTFENIMTNRTIIILDGFVMGNWFHGELVRTSENEYISGEEQNTIFRFQADGNLRVYQMSWFCEEYWVFEFVLFDGEVLNMGNVFGNMHASDSGWLSWDMGYLNEWNLSWTNRSLVVRTDIQRAGENNTEVVFGFLPHLYDTLRVGTGRNRIRVQVFGVRLINDGQIEFLESNISSLTVRISRIIYEETASPTNVRIVNHQLVWQEQHDNFVNNYVYVKSAGNETFENKTRDVHGRFLVGSLGLEQGRNVVRLSSIDWERSLNRGILRVWTVSQSVYFDVYINEVIKGQMPVPFNLEFEWRRLWEVDYFQWSLSWEVPSAGYIIQPNSTVWSYLYIKWEGEDSWIRVNEGEGRWRMYSQYSQIVEGGIFQIRVKTVGRSVLYENGSLVIITDSDYVYFELDITT